MTLAKEAGVDKKAAKAALLEHNDDYDAALAKLHADAPGAEEGGASSVELMLISLKEAAAAVQRAAGRGRRRPGAASAARRALGPRAAVPTAARGCRGHRR